MSSIEYAEKTPDAAGDEVRKIEVHHVDGVSSSEIASPDLKAEGRAVNALLILACVAFGAASFLFGFDNNVISPVVALEPFVCRFNCI